MAQALKKFGIKDFAKMMTLHWIYSGTSYHKELLSETEMDTKHLVFAV